MIGKYKQCFVRNNSSLDILLVFLDPSEHTSIHLNLTLQWNMFSQSSFLFLFLALIPPSTAQPQSRSVFNYFFENKNIGLKNVRERHKGIHA